MTQPPADAGAGGGGDARGLVLISTAVAQMVVPILIGVWLDNRYGWGPWGMAGGAILGLVGGGWMLWRIVRRMNRTDRPGGAPPTEH